MSIEGMQRVQARMAAIEARISAQLAQASPQVAGGPLGAGAVADPSMAGTDFADVLRQVTETYGGSTSGVAERKAPGAYGPLDPPAALRAYGNGKIPAQALESLGIGSHRLYAPAAQSYKRMVTDAAHAGVSIGITDSYRGYAEQVSLAEEKGLHRNGGLAAVPGTSAHGWGLAVDLDLDDRAQTWMREHAWQYGFAEDTPREPWHWTYRPA